MQHGITKRCTFAETKIFLMQKQLFKQQKESNYEKD